MKDSVDASEEKSAMTHGYWTWGCDPRRNRDLINSLIANIFDKQHVSSVALGSRIMFSVCGITLWNHEI